MSMVAEPRDAAAAVGATDSGSPVRRWDRSLARVLLALWAVGMIAAWVLGTRVVGVDQLELDVESGAVQQLTVESTVSGSAWWAMLGEREPEMSDADAEPGIVLYRTSDSVFARTYAVAPPGSVEGGVPGSRGFSGAMNDWGDRQSEVERLIDRAQPESPRQLSFQHTWTTAIVPVAMLVGFLGSLAMLLTRRPERGNRWYWFWLLLIVPGGLGWATYAWREYLARDAGRPQSSRDGGFTGFVLALAAAFLLAVAGMILVSLLGVTVLPG